MDKAGGRVFDELVVRAKEVSDNPRFVAIALTSVSPTMAGKRAEKAGLSESRIKAIVDLARIFRDFPERIMELWEEDTMDTMDYVPMRCREFVAWLSHHKQWNTKPERMRRMKLHALVCPDCRKKIEDAAPQQQPLQVILNEVQVLEEAERDMIQGFSDVTDLSLKEAMFESFRFFQDSDPEESDANQVPLSFSEWPIPTRLEPDGHDKIREEHFRRQLDDEE